VRFGKLGTNGQTSEKELGSPAEAKKQEAKLIAEKTKKGYVEVDGGKAATGKVAAAGEVAASGKGTAAAASLFETRMSLLASIEPKERCCGGGNLKSQSTSMVGPSRTACSS
jgi:predicted DNA-binding WGR domain protein